MLIENDSAVNNQRSMFHFKQFAVNQSDCAMKINTDGVLLGALVEAKAAAKILDVGTGTGVIAMMLAQRFTDALIDAIEIDEPSANTAARNFVNAPFKNKPNLYQGSFQKYFNAYRDKRYDLIVSNPPFYINSLSPSAKQMELAKHADVGFFENLLTDVAGHLTENGECWLILPLPTAQLVIQLATQQGLSLQKTISIQSFATSAPHREMIVFSRDPAKQQNETFVIYRDVKLYSEQYRDKLKEYLTIF